MYPESPQSSGAELDGNDQNSLPVQEQSAFHDTSSLQDGSDIDATKSQTTNKQKNPFRYITFTKRRVMIVSAFITLFVLILTVATVGLLTKNQRDSNVSESTIPSQGIELDAEDSIQPDEITGEQEALYVTGDIITKSSLKVSKDGFVVLLQTGALTANQEIILPNDSGTLCLDSNNCDFATAEQIQQLQNQIGPLQNQLGQIVIPSIPDIPASSLVNNQEGAVSIQGTSNRVSVTTSNGIIKLSTPQDLATISSPTFASLLLTGNLNVGGTLTLPLNCSALVNGGALTTNGAGQVICSDDDGGGSGTVDSPGGTPGTIPIFTAAQTIADSIISQALGTITVSGDLAATGDLSTTNLTISGLSNGFLRVDGSGVVSVNTIDLGTDTDGSYVLGVTGGNGINIGGVAGEGWTPSVSLALQANKGLEVDGNGLSLIDCGLDQVLKYNGANQWACAADNGAGSAFTTIGTPGGTDPVADSSSDTLQFIASGTNITIVGADDPESITFDIVESVLAGNGLGFSGDGLVINSGSGIQITGDAVALGSLTANWNQTGAFDIVLNNSGSELIILDSDGTHSATFDVGNLTANATYTFSGASGLVLTDANYTATLDPVYVNVGESPAAGDVSGSFSGGLLVNSVQNNSVDLGTDTVGNYVATVTAGAGLTGSASGEGSMPLLAIGSANGGIVVNADDIALTLQASADALSSTTSSGSGLEILAGGLTLLQGCSDGEVLKWNETTDTWGCAADGAGSGVTTVGALDGQPKSANGAVISGNSIYLQTADGSNPGLVSTGVQTFAGNKTFTGNLDIQGGSLVVGLASTNTGSIALHNATNANTVTLQSGVTGASYTLTLPTAVGSANQCLKAQNGTGTLFWDNCLGGGGGGGITSINSQTGPSITINNASGAGNAITIDDAVADGSTKGIAAFDGTNFSSASGVINTIQNINTAASPQFTNLTLTGDLDVQGGTATIGTNALAGNLVLHEGDGDTADLVVGAQSGNQTYTFLQGGTVITSGNIAANAVTTVTAGSGLTGGGGPGAISLDIGAGNGIAVNANDITLSLQASKGLEVDGNGLSLIDCAQDEILKYNGSNQWACASDDDGSGGGFVTGSGTQNTLSKFDATGTNLVDSTITDDGSTVTTTGDLAVQGGDINIGQASATSGSLVFYNSTNANTVTIQSGVTANTYSLTLPTDAGTQYQCLKYDTGGQLIWDDCDGGSGGGSGVTALNTFTGSVTIQGTANQVNVNNAGNVITLSTPQDINSGATPTFAGLTLNGNLSIGTNSIVTGSTTISSTELDRLDGKDAALVDINDAVNTAITGTGALNSGSITSGFGSIDVGADAISTTGTITAGTLSVNSESFTDLTGFGLQNSTNVLALALQANKGLEVDGNGLSLIDCGNGQILKYETTGNTWGCDNDGAGSGVTTIGALDGQAKNANGATISGNTLYLQTADGSNPGLVSTGAQSFAGVKTFSSQITANAGITSPGVGANSEYFGAGATTSTHASTLAVGTNASVSGGASVAVGFNASSTINGTAIGASASAGGTSTGSVAVGNSATVTNHAGVAIGGNSTAGLSAIALGPSSSATFQGSVAIGVSSTTTATNQLVIGGSGGGNRISSVFIGNGVTNAAPVGFTLNATGGSGTDIQGANLTIAGGRGTGNVAGGDIIFQSTASGQGTGSTLRTLTEIARFTSSGQLTFGTSQDTNLFRNAANVLRTNDALIVDGQLTANGGLLVEAGDTLTFNSDAFTDLTGNGLQVSANALTLLLQANKGLEVDGNGLSLIDCSSGEVLKYNGSNQWACATDNGTGVAPTLQDVYDNSASPATILTADAKNIEITLANTATDANFTVDIATGSTGEFQVEANGTDVLQIGSAGQLQLDVQGSSGGILLGTDVNLYRATTASQPALRTDDSFIQQTTYTDPAEATWGSRFNSTFNLTAANANTMAGIYVSPTFSGTANHTGATIGIDGEASWASSGTANSLIGARLQATVNSGAGAVTDATGAWLQVTNNSSNTLTDARGIRIVNPGGSGTITNAYGIDINAQTRGATNNYGIRIAEPSGGSNNNAALYLSGTSGTANGGILFGGDTNLYRSGANQITTDDSFGIGVAPTADLHISRTGSATLRIDADTDDTNEEDLPLLVLTSDGGNGEAVFGKNGSAAQYTGAISNAAYLGSTTQHHLQFITNDIARLTIHDINGNVGIGDTDPSTRLSLGGTGSANGITLGDDAADPVNLYRSAANTLKTDDSFLVQTTADSTTAFQVIDADGGTPVLSVDTTNERVGIGIAAPETITHLRTATNSDSTILRLDTGTLGANTGTAGIQFREHSAGANEYVNGFNVGYDAGTNQFNIQALDQSVTSTVASFDRADGSALFQNFINSTTALQVQNSAGVSLLQVDTTPDSENLVTNGSFEINTTGWAAKNGSGTSTLTRVTTQQRIGAASLRIATTGADSTNAGARYDITLANSTNYALNFWAKLNSGTMTDLKFGYSSDGTQGGEVDCDSGQTVITGTWLNYTCTFTTPASNSGTPYIYISQGGATNQTYFIDGVKLRQGTSQVQTYKEGQIGFNSHVGIGTYNPLTALQVAGGDILLDNGARIRFFDSSGNMRDVLGYSSANNVQLRNIATTGSVQIINANAGGSIQFSTGASSTLRGRFLATGEFNLGTTAAANSLLSLDGTGSANGITLGDDQASPANLYHNGANTLKTDDSFIVGIDNDNAFIVEQAGGTDVFAVDTNGAGATGVTIGGGTQIEKVLHFAVDVDPAAGVANTATCNTGTVTGAVTTDRIVANPDPADLENSYSWHGARVSASNTIEACFVSAAAVPADPGGAITVFGLIITP